MKKIILKSRSHSYPVYIGDQKILKNLGRHFNSLKLGHRLIVITSPSLFKWYGPSLRKCFPASVTLDFILISDREKDKNMKTVQKTLSRLLSLKAYRKSCLVAFGGGVIGDITGFVASIYMRGIPFISIPTTLLAQVDSSLGGKCGVNTKEGKNLVGSFYPPKAIFSEISFLKTLPQKHYQSGLAEVIKYAVIDPQGLWNILETSSQKILDRDPKILEKVIVASILTKKKFIEEDEQDFSKRQILNFGHTVGHALEALSRYQSLTHGEAIAQGMHYAADLSLQKKLCSSKTTQDIHSLLKKYGFQKKSLPKQFSSYLARDKKRDHEAISWILIKDIGHPQRVSIPQEAF